MIAGVVRETREFGEIENFDMYGYLVADPESEAAWPQYVLTVVAQRSGIDLGYAHLDRLAHGHTILGDVVDAFDTVLFTDLIPQAIEDARLTLASLIR